MLPQDLQAITESARQARARARYLVSRSMEAQATAAELTVIAGELRSRLRAECERASSLALESAGHRLTR